MKVPVYERRLGIQPMSIPNAPTLQPISDNGEGTGKAMQDMFARLQKINDDIEDARTLELFTKFKQESHDYHEHPDKGLYRTRLGFEARGVYSDADQWMRQKGEEYVQQLPSERAKGAFRKMAKDYIIQRGEQNSKFEADQKRQYIDQSTDAAIKNAIMMAGKYWDDNKRVEQIRAEIYPALELRLRGAGREAFKNALAEIEDRIGTIRVAQALARHPLQALEMLRNPDVHLKPETRAKLQLTMEQHAEVYELQAIAEEYAKHYTPETAVKAREKLNEVYGYDKGQKAFAALQRIWAVAQGQEVAIKKNERERQEKNEDQLRIQIGDPNRPNPTDEQLTRSVEAGNISAQFYLQAMRTNESDREKAERERKRKAKNELWARVSNNDFPTLEELQRGVEAGEIDPSDADYATRRREEHERETYEQNESAILDKIFFGTASVAEIEQARKDGKIRAQFASTAKNHLTTILTKSESERREDYENMLITMAREGTFKNPERVNELLRQKRISRGVAGTLWSIMDAAPAREAQELSRQQSKNADEVILKMINGNISIEEIKKGANDGTLDPNFARGAINYLEGLQEKDERKKQEKIESAISLIIENGGRVPREQINDLQQKGFISPAFGSRVRSKYDSEDEAAARQAAQAERERTKQERKLQAQKAAREIMEEFGDDFAGALDAVNAIPASEYANDVRSELEHLIQARKTHAQQQQQGTKDAQETAYRKYYADAYGGKMSRDDIHKLWQDKVISEAQRDNLYQLINARERNDIQQLKKLVDEQGFITAQKLMEKHNGDIAAARREIEALGPGDLYDATFKYLSQFAQTYRTGKQQETDAIKQAQEKVFNETWTEFIHGGADRKKANRLREEQLISHEQWTRLISIVEQQEKARAKVQEELRKDRLYDTARDIAREFGENDPQAGYARIEELYQGNRKDIEDAKKYFDQFRAEQAAQRQTIDRQRAEAQRVKYIELADTYWRKYQPVPSEVLRQLERERGLSPEQIARAEAMNAKMHERTGLIEQMRSNGEDVEHMTLPVLETRLQQLRGISEDAHRETVARLLKHATEGTLTDEEIDWEYASGRLWGDDRERLKKFDSKLDQDRKRKIRETERVILGSIMKHANPKEKVALMYMARTLFYLGTDAIDTRAPDFFKALEEVQKNVEMAVYEAITEGKPQTEGMLWWEKPSAPVRRGTAILNTPFLAEETIPTFPYISQGGTAGYIRPTGEIVPFPTETVLPQVLQRQSVQEQSTVPETPSSMDIALSQGLPTFQPYAPEFMVSGDEVPPPQVPAVPPPQSPNTLAPTQDPAPQPTPPQSPTPATAPVPTGNPLVMGFVKGGTVPNGGGFTASRGYRGGQHKGLDISAAEGTPVKMVDFGTHMSVKKVHTDNPSSGLGDYVELWGQYPNGDIIEVSLGHFQRGTIRVKPRVIIGAGVLIGNVGNTGMTSDREKGGVTGWYEGKKSGYHLDIKIKINGKYVDPETFTPPVDSSPSLNALVEQLHPQPPQIPQAPQPQPYSPLVESTDAQRMDRIQELLLFNLFPDIGFGYSGDLNLGRTMF